MTTTVITISVVLGLALAGTYYAGYCKGCDRTADYAIDHLMSGVREFMLLSGEVELYGRLLPYLDGLIEDDGE